MKQTKAPPIQKRQQPHPGTHHQKTQSDGAAKRPVPAKRVHKSSKLHQPNGGTKRNDEATPMRSESTSTLRSSPCEKRAAATVLNSKAPKKSPPPAPPRAALKAKTRTARAALALGIKNLDSLCSTGKRLTFVPMSAWVNNVDEDDGVMKAETAKMSRKRSDTQLPVGQFKELSLARDPSGKRGGVQWPWDHTLDESSFKSVSTFEQQFSLDGQLTSSSSSSLKVQSQEQLSPSITRTPQSRQTSSASSPSPPSPPTCPQRPPSPPPPPPPPRSPLLHQRPPPPPPRTVSAGHRRVLRHPSDVAALLHEVLKGSSGLGELSEKVSTGQVSKARKSNGAEVSSSSQDSCLLDTLARIIADKISSGDHMKSKRKGKNMQAAALDQLDVNRALLATGESNCNGDGHVDAKKSSGLRSKAAKCHSHRQQNGNNCCEKPSKKVRYLAQHSHLSTMSEQQHISHGPWKCSDSNNLMVGSLCTAHSNRLHGIELLTGKLKARERQGSPDHNQRRAAQDRKVLTPVSPATSSKYGSNTSRRAFQGACKPLSQCFCSQPSRRTIKADYSTQPSGAPDSEGSRSQRRSPSCSAADNGSTKCRHCEGVITASNTGSCSTEDDIFAEQNVSLSNVQADSRPCPKCNCADWHGTTEGVSLVGSSSKALETTVDSPSITTDKSRCQWQQLHSAAASVKQLKDPEQCTSAEYAQQLFGSLLKSQDESGLLRPLAKAPKELSLRSQFQGTPHVDGETETLLKRSPLKIFLPQFMLGGKAEGSAGQGSDATHGASMNISTKRVDVRMPIPPINLTPEKSTKSDSLVSPPVARPVELPTVASLQYQLTECIDWTAKCLSRRSGHTGHKSRPNQPDYKTARRRSRIHVVEPLVDAVQQRIQLPMDIIEKLFSSSRPIKYSQLLMFIVPIFSIENILDASESLFCPCNGSVITAGSNLASTVSKHDCCCISESVNFSFARRMASRILESLGISNILLDSPIVAGLLNQSLIKPGWVPADHKFRERNRFGLVYPNRVVDIGQHWDSSGSHHKVSVREARNSIKWHHSDHIANQDIELLQVTTNLAVRFRRAKRPDRRRHSRHRHSRGSGALSRSSRISRSPFTSDATTEAEFLHQDLAQRLAPDFVSCRPCTTIADTDSVVNECTQLESGDCPRTILSHCPELITNPNLNSYQTVTSNTEEPFAVNSEPHGYTIDTATSDFASAETIAMQQCVMPNPPDQTRTLRERTVEVSDEVVTHANNLHPLAIDGGCLGLLRTVEVPMFERPHRQQQQKQQLVRQHWHQQAGLSGTPNSADCIWDGLDQADPVTAKCPCQDVNSCGTDLTQRRSYNSHSFRSRTAAIIPGSGEDNRGVLLNITCQLTVVDRAVDSCSFEESISTDCSELVYA